MIDLEPVQRRLNHILKRETIPSALLFSGDSSDSLEREAYRFLSQLLLKSPSETLFIHPDLHIYYPEGKTAMHSIETIRSLCDEVSLVAYASTWKCFLIHEAERMLPTSSNALLKTLEEPPAKTLFLLTSIAPQKLLPTLISRCQTFHFHVHSPQDEELAHAFFAFFPHDLSKEKIFEFAQIFDTQEIKSSDDEVLTAQQKERLRLEEEGRSALIFHKKVSILFQILIQWYRDRWLSELNVSSDFFFYSSYIEQLIHTPFMPMREVEKGIADARQALERGMKLSSCLENLFSRLRLLT